MILIDFIPEFIVYLISAIFIYYSVKYIESNYDPNEWEGLDD